MTTQHSARGATPKTARLSAGRLLWHGVIGGVVAGIFFALAATVLALLVGEPFWGQIRLIAGIVLGGGVLAPDYPLVQAIVVGTLLHLALSALYGVIFVYLLARTGQLRSATGLLLFFGWDYGLMLWLVNYLVLAVLIFPPLTVPNQLWIGFVAHTFFYGTSLAAYLAVVRPQGAGIAIW